MNHYIQLKEFEQIRIYDGLRQGKSMTMFGQRIERNNRHPNVFLQSRKSMAERICRKYEWIAASVPTILTCLTIHNPRIS